MWAFWRTCFRLRVSRTRKTAVRALGDTDEFLDATGFWGSTPDLGPNAHVKSGWDTRYAAKSDGVPL